MGTNPPEQQPEEDPTPRNQLKGNKMAAKGVFCFLLVSALATLATAYPGKMDLASVMCPATLTVATSSKPQAYQGASLSMPASSRMGFFCCLAENRCFYLFFYFFIFLFRKIYVEGKATTNSFLSDAMNF